jgi:hypothetical protein
MAALTLPVSRSVKHVKGDKFEKIADACANPPKASFRSKQMVAKGRALKKPRYKTSVGVPD